MPTRILEYNGVGNQRVYPVVPADQFITKQAAMTATGTSAQSAALSANTRVICVQSDEQIYVEPGLNPTATTDSYRIPAGGEQYFSVERNAGWKVAIRT